MKVFTFLLSLFFMTPNALAEGAKNCLGDNIVEGADSGVNIQIEGIKKVVLRDFDKVVIEEWNEKYLQLNFSIQGKGMYTFLVREKKKKLVYYPLRIVDQHSRGPSTTSVLVKVPANRRKPYKRSTIFC